MSKILLTCQLFSDLWQVTNTKVKFSQAILLKFKTCLNRRLSRKQNVCGQIAICLWPNRNQNYGKLIKLHPSKVTRQSEKTETTSLVAVFYSSSERTSCSRSYTLLKKLAWRSYLFVSKLLNHLGLISITSIYQIPQLNIHCSTLL